MNQEIISLKQKINRGDICVGAVTSVQVGFEELKRILETVRDNLTTMIDDLATEVNYIH